MEKRVEILKILAALGEYYDKPLSPTQLAAYSEDLMCMEPEELVRAVKSYRNDPRNDRFPLPVKLKSMIGMVLNPDDEAVQIAGRIMSAIASIGPYQTERAREAIGEVGWRVVVAEGGWQTICEVHTDDLPIRKAQWRNLAKSFCEKQVRGESFQQIRYAPTALGKFDVSKLLIQMPKGDEPKESA